MRKAIRERHYSEFTPAERMKLILKAAARNDQEEIKLLFSPCPTEYYKVSDLAFKRKMVEFEALALKAGQIVLKHLLTWSWLKFAGNPKSLAEEKSLEKTAGESMTSLCTFFKAFDLFCREVADLSGMETLRIYSLPAFEIMELFWDLINSMMQMKNSQGEAEAQELSSSLLEVWKNRQ